MRFFFVLLLTLLTSCSNLSKNLVKEGDFTIKGGVYDQIRWEAPLSFKRYSWYHELTLIYDLLAAEITQDSSFYKWFSAIEQSSLSSCPRIFLTIQYQMDSNRASMKDVEGQLQKQGANYVATPYFEQNIKNHPDFERLGLQLYKLKTYCLQNSDNKFQVLIPGYPRIDIGH